MPQVCVSWRTPGCGNRPGSAGPGTAGRVSCLGGRRYGAALRPARVAAVGAARGGGATECRLDLGPGSGLATPGPGPCAGRPSGSDGRSDRACGAAAAGHGRAPDPGRRTRGGPPAGEVVLGWEWSSPAGWAGYCDLHLALVDDMERDPRHVVPRIRLVLEMGVAGCALAWDRRGDGTPLLGAEVTVDAVPHGGCGLALRRGQPQPGLGPRAPPRQPARALLPSGPSGTGRVPSLAAGRGWRSLAGGAEH